MKIGLRGGHSAKCIGAVGLVNEYEQMQKFYTHVETMLKNAGHTVINCNSNATTSSQELFEGVSKANYWNVDIFISLHMNAFNGSANGTECLVSSVNSGSYPFAKRICDNFAKLGFKNRGVKESALYEMKNVKAPNIIFEVCFCDSKVDMDIYNKYSWEQLAYALCSAIDTNITLSAEQEKGYIVTSYLPTAYAGYDGVDIKDILEYFEGVKTYVRGNNKGIWIETQMLDINKCLELKNKLGSLFYSIEK